MVQIQTPSGIFNTLPALPASALGWMVLAKRTVSEDMASNHNTHITSISGTMMSTEVVIMNLFHMDASEGPWATCVYKCLRLDQMSL